ncbi:hypothetical protein GCM10023083_79260 [Streptomyces phyllanthi]
MNVPGPDSGMEIRDELDDARGDLLGDLPGEAEGLRVAEGLDVGAGARTVGWARVVELASDGNSPVSRCAHPTAASPAAPRAASAASPAHIGFFPKRRRPRRRLPLRLRLRLRPLRPRALEVDALRAVMFLQSVITV